VQRSQLIYDWRDKVPHVKMGSHRLFQTQVVYETFKSALWEISKRSCAGSQEVLLSACFPVIQQRWFFGVKTRQNQTYLSWKLTIHDKVFHENQQVYNFCWDLLASYTEMYVNQ